MLPKSGIAQSIDSSWAGNGNRADWFTGILAADTLTPPLELMLMFNSNLRVISHSPCLVIIVVGWYCCNALALD